MILLYYFAGVYLGTIIGREHERKQNSYYYHTEKIIILENKLKEYERLFGKK
jgi:hypothetical protein